MIMNWFCITLLKMLAYKEGLLYLFHGYQAEVGLTAVLHALGVADTDIRVSAENVDT